MSGWVGSGGGPPGEGDADGAFRDSVARAVSQWRERLGGPSGGGETARLAPVIRQEAVALRAAAQARGCTEIAQRLHRIELCSDQAPHALAGEVDALAATLPGGRPPAAAVATPLPGGTIVMSARPQGSAPARPVAAAAPPPAVPSPPPPGASGPAASGPRAAAASSAPKSLAQTMFGLRGFRRGSGSAPPRSSGADRGSLLNLRDLHSAGAAPQAPDMPWEAKRSSGPRPSGVMGSRASSRPSWKSAAPPSPRPRRSGWLYAIGAGMAAVAGVAATLAAVWPRATPQARGAGAGAGTGPAASSVPDAAPPPAHETSPVEQITAAIHRIGQESDQLRALIDTQGRWAAQCLDDSTQCGHGYTPQSIWAMRPIDGGVPAPVEAQKPLSVWLRSLRLPSDFPLFDGSILREMFDYDVRNIEGRQRLESMLFKCSAYEHIFASTIERYGAPEWLSAVVYQESGCSPRAKSLVGAMGLWQFMPESARAYGLKVVDGQVDERLNPVKSTDAAVHMLTDLERKFGAWDMALAAYNMGPFALTVRLEQVGGNQTFWQLSAADLLPDETARYVPAIEAFALALENRARLGLPADGPPLESTAEVSVKPGTRLSLIARAAHTSTAHIRDLNPEFLHDAVPDGETTARVPDSEAHRAQELLDAPPGDDDDLCVPETFDWGRDRFPNSRYEAACRRDR